VTENERPLPPVHHNILAASPYGIVHTVRHVQQHASPLRLPDPNVRHQAQCDPGANIRATNNILVLRDTVHLKTPFPISSADRTAPAMTALILGTFVLPLSIGSTCDIMMYYCPSLADTIVSPQHFMSSAIAARRYNGYCLIDMTGCYHILLSHSNDNDASFFSLNKSNNLYFISGSTPDSSGSRVSRLATKPQLLSELWHQRLGHPGPTQLVVLAKHSTGLPSLLTMHPIHSCQACNDGKSIMLTRARYQTRLFSCQALGFTLILASSVLRLPTLVLRRFIVWSLPTMVINIPHHCMCQDTPNMGILSSLQVASDFHH
jgi:hypothetical protein